MIQCELLIIVTSPQNHKWVQSDVCVFYSVTLLTEGVPQKDNDNNDI